MKQKARMNKWSHSFFLILAFGIFACKGTNNPHGSTTSPTQSKAVFTEYLTPLEGEWKGRILTYSDLRGQVAETPQPKDFTPKLIIARPTKTEKVTSVTRTYTNEDAFNQRVKIVEQIKGQEIYTHHGARKIEDGIITSIVNKFEGTEKSVGYKDQDGNFVWIREQAKPKILEFFKHIKKDKQIRVIGWGYYGEDDLSKAPRIWYLGDLVKVEKGK